MLLAELGDYLEGEGLVTQASDFFLGFVPTAPAECCALFEYSGEPPLRSQNEGAASSSAQGAERRGKGDDRRIRECTEDLRNARG